MHRQGDNFVYGCSQCTAQPLSICRDTIHRSNGGQVDEFHAKMKHLFRNIRPKDFKDTDPTAEFDWNQAIDGAERQRNSKK